MKLTRYQTSVLRYMRDERQAAVRFGDRWIWPQDIRQDAELAKRLYQSKHDPQFAERAAADAERRGYHAVAAQYRKLAAKYRDA